MIIRFPFSAQPNTVYVYALGLIMGCKYVYFSQTKTHLLKWRYIIYICQLRYILKSKHWLEVLTHFTLSELDFYETYTFRTFSSSTVQSNLLRFAGSEVRFILQLRNNRPKICINAFTLLWDSKSPSQWKK